MDIALRGALDAFLLDTPWIILGCVPILPRLRVRQRTLWLLVALVVAAECLGQIPIIYFNLGGNWILYSNLSRYVEYALFIVIMWRCFTIEAGKILNLLLTLVMLATMVNTLSRSFNRLLFGMDAGGFASNPYYTLVGAVCIAIVAPFVYRFFRHRLRDAYEVLTGREVLFICIPLVLFSVAHEMYLLLEVFYSPSPYYTSLLMLIVDFVGITTYYVTLRSTMVAAQRARMETDMRHMQQQLHLQAQHYGQLTGSIEQAKNAQHDLRHHLSAMARLAEDGNLDGLNSYLQAYGGSVQADEVPLSSGRHVVDAIAQHYLALAREAGGEVDFLASIPEACAVTDTDLCILFGNILENAVHSLQRQQTGHKFIRCRCREVGANLVLRVENSCSFPASASMAGEEKPQGIGLASVQAVAAKYGGSAKFYEEDGVYHSGVVLPLPPAPEGQA